MSYDRLVLIRHSSNLRSIGDAEVRDALAAEERAQLITDVQVDTAAFESEIDGGYWDRSHEYIRRAAADVRAQAESLNSPRLHYFGLAEIPHVIALGSYIGDERHVVVHDYDYTNDQWAWSQTGQTLEVGVTQLPRDVVRSPGNIVIRIGLSGVITDDAVEAAIGKERLGDVLIFPANHDGPAPGLIRSADDVKALREAFRTVLASVVITRPNADVIHLFVAAPCSVCFVVGQELRLRSGLDVQTYRYRTGIDGGPYFEAILLTSRELMDEATPLSEAERARVEYVRTTVLPATLTGIKQYALAKREAASEKDRPWYHYLQPHEALATAAPYSDLPRIWEVIGDRDGIAEEPRADAYGRDKDDSVWRWSDSVLLGLDRAAQGNDARLSELLRLFFFHEYLHDWQSLTKYSAEDVGSFANCLERIDYIADLYAILHQLDHTMRTDRARVADEAKQLSFIADQIGLALQSFWAFDPRPPQARWQERRLRRYLNWFWRRVQVLRARDLDKEQLATALRTLGRQPTIELAGLEYRLGPGRIFVVLDRVRAGEHLEIGLVLEDQRFWRAGSAGNMSLEALVAAFIQHDHEAIQLFFNSLFENVSATGGVFVAA